MRVWPVAAGLSVGGRVEIKGPDARHILTVLRLGAGDFIKVSDRDSRLLEARIVTTEKNLVVAEITQNLKTATLKKPAVTLAVSLSKQSVMEIIAQKAVELGCDGLVPVVTKRSLYKKMSDSKLARIRRIAHEASKQSGNVAHMTVSEPVEPEGLPAADFKLLLWEGEKARTLKSALDHIGTPSSLLLMVGPPGGFDADEVELFKQNGFVTAGLGGLIQRTETAAISLMAVVNYHFGRI